MNSGCVCITVKLNEVVMDFRERGTQEELEGEKGGSYIHTLVTCAI